MKKIIIPGFFLATLLIAGFIFSFNRTETGNSPETENAAIEQQAEKLVAVSQKVDSSKGVLPKGATGALTAIPAEGENLSTTTSANKGTAAPLSFGAVSDELNSNPKAAIHGAWVVEDFSFLPRKQEAAGGYTDLANKKNERTPHYFVNGITKTGDSDRPFSYEFKEGNLYIWDPADVSGTVQLTNAVIKGSRTQVFQFQFSTEGKMKLLQENAYFRLEVIFSKEN